MFDLKKEDADKLQALTTEYATTDMTRETVAVRLEEILLPYVPDFQPHHPGITVKGIVASVMDLYPPKPPYRVAVKDGAGTKDLGKGTYVGNVEVYFMVGPQGVILSQKNAEVPPDEVPPDTKVIKRGGNPKIVLDSGEVVYGCQVWWEPIDEPMPVAG